MEYIAIIGLCVPKDIQSPKKEAKDTFDKYFYDFVKELSGIDAKRYRF